MTTAQTQDISIPSWLLETVFCAEYSVNCPKQWLVRLCGCRRGMIDKRPVSQTKDAIGYGATLEEAANAARQRQMEMAAGQVAVSGEGVEWLIIKKQRSV